MYANAQDGPVVPEEHARHLFAPKDIVLERFEAKNDLHGIGYKPMVRHHIQSHSFTDS